MVQNNDTMLKVSRLLATGLEILVANAKFSVALATSWSQFRTLKEPTHYSKRAGHEVPGVVAGLCESLGMGGY